MATLDDIMAQKKAALAMLDSEIVDGLTKKNAALDDGQDEQADQLDHRVQGLMDQRQAVLLQAYLGALQSKEMADALNALKAATDDMSAVAQKMKTLTGFINNAADLISAAGEVTKALKAHTA